MIAIPLRNKPGDVVAHALVDDEDAAYAHRRWHLNASGYAVHNYWDGVSYKTVHLHRELLGLVRGDGLQGDHVNRDRLDNRRKNLRVVTKDQNAQNRGSDRDATSSHRGVHWNGRRWVAQGTRAGRRCYLGSFRSEREAAMAASNFRAEYMPFAVEV